MALAARIWGRLPRDLVDKVLGAALAAEKHGSDARLVSREGRKRANEAAPEQGWHAKQLRKYYSDFYPQPYVRTDQKSEWLGWVVLRRPGLTAEVERAVGYRALWMACKYGNLAVVKYLCGHLGLTVEDARASDNFALRAACERGYLEIVKYLCSYFELASADACANNNGALWQACRHGRLSVVRHLHEHFGLTAVDARATHHEAFRRALADSHRDEVTQYLEAWAAA